MTTTAARLPDAPPRALLDTPLLAAGRHLDRTAVIGAQRAWRWREIHQASIAFSHRLGDAASVCNLCTSRVAFLVTLLAALRQRRQTVLPPSGGHADLAGVLEPGARAVIVVDDPRAIQPAWRGVADCLVCEPSPAEALASELAWQPAWHERAVVLYTSGSTGAPEPQPKTLLQLAVGALVLGDRLSHDIPGGLPALQRIVCSVPPQHMFGVEASVMLSLVHAIPVLDRRPLLPADVHDAFATPPAALWIATPLHLRGLVQTDLRLAHCAAVIASTMPLASSLAQQAEARIQGPVLEIYGSTETGVLAMRRSASDTDWRPVRDVRIEPIDDGALAFGAHFESPVTLPDRIELGASGRFTLLGRQADLIKIAGRRASLAGLNLLLHDMPGFEDGVFYLPATGSPTERLCLIHTGTLPRAAIEQWLRSRLDPAFLPRTVIRVDRLPRGDSGKLPRQALDELHAAWQAGVSPARAARASRQFEFAVAATHPALPGHFPGQPIVPGVLLLDHVLRGVAAALGRPVQGLQQVKFAAALLPGETARVAWDEDGARVRFKVDTLRAGVPVALAGGSLRLATTAAAS